MPVSVHETQNTVGHIKNKKPTLSSSVAFQIFFMPGRGLPLAGGGLALTEDHVVYIDAGEGLCHVRYHFLSILD